MLCLSSCYYCWGAWGSWRLYRYLQGFYSRKISNGDYSASDASSILGGTQYKAHNASASRQVRLKEYVNKLWNDILEGKLSDTQLEVESRNLQNEIYENRSNNPLIFDRIYKILKNKQEEQMNKSAEMLLKEVKESDRKSECS